MHKDFRNIFLALALFLFSVLSLSYIIPKGIFVPASIKIRVMSPAFFPETISIFLALMSLILALQHIVLLRRRKYEKSMMEQFEQPESQQDDLPPLLKTLKVVSAIVLLFLYYKTVTWIGILYASMLFLLFFSVLYGEKRFKITLPLAVALSLFIYLFFTKIAQIPLPKGSLFE
ncbi:MAG: tripartite tricarboxylate transporter TctB family protein [Deltaproteobacteria bacterium]|nr:tripartite tricarboxylate transporter TctB family protein [Deltaproteobacteria bacterium]